MASAYRTRLGLFKLASPFRPSQTLNVKPWNVGRGIVGTGIGVGRYDTRVRG